MLRGPAIPALRNSARVRSAAAGSGTPGSPRTMTVPVAISTFAQEYDIRYGEMAAGTLLSILPALVLILFGQRFVVRGLLAGAIK